MANLNYSEKMFDYLTIEENFIAALEMRELLAKTEIRLLDEFWKIVTDELESQINNYCKQHDLEVKFISNKTDSTVPWFKIIKDDWQYFIIDTDKEDVGIKNLGNADSMKCNEVSIRDLLVSDLKFENLTWICWKKIKDNRLENISEKVKLLPNLREETAKECSNVIYTYVLKLIAACEKINNNLNVK